jgi:ADP-ribosylglycohydrolase
MKAWEWTHNLTRDAVPQTLAAEEQTWAMLNDVQKAGDALLAAQWSSKVPGSSAPESVIAGAVQSVESMGRNVGAAEAILERGLDALRAGDLQSLNTHTARLYKALHEAPVDETSPYWHHRLYNSWDAYEGAVSFPAPVNINNDDSFYDRTRAAWLGRLAGGALGTALEGYTSQALRKHFGEIRDYVRAPNTYNDDITYEIAFLETFASRGADVTSGDIADKWLALVPSGWSAEQVALDNLRKGIYPPESGSYRNPYCEWIGAQMRGAICGQAAPGNAREAARLAWLDGVISHSGNGVLGEVFNAVLVSLSFIQKDMRQNLASAVSAIPKDSEYYSVLDFAFEQTKQGNADDAWLACEKKYKTYNWIHAYPNAAAEVIALWFGNGDFDETMHCIAMCGQDVDCNAAQIGAALGAAGGTAAIPERWYTPLGGTVVTYLRGMKEIPLQTLVDKTVRAVRNSAR